MTNSDMLEGREAPEKWARVSNQVLHSGLFLCGEDYRHLPKLTGHAKAVFVALRSFCFGRKLVCHPGLGTLADVTGFSKSTVQRGLRELMSVGLVRVTKQSDGGRESNHYFVEWDFSTIPRGSSLTDHTGNSGIVSQTRHPSLTDQAPWSDRPPNKTREEDNEQDNEEGGQLSLTPPSSSPPDPTVLTFTGLLRSNGIDTWELKASMLKKLEENFEGVDVLAALREAQMKIELKALNRVPTARRMTRFITNWLKNEQDRPRSNGRAAPEAQATDRPPPGVSWREWTRKKELKEALDNSPMKALHEEWQRKGLRRPEDIIADSLRSRSRAPEDKPRPPKRVAHKSQLTATGAVFDVDWEES